MKLAEFEITNYRNITHPVKIRLGQYNVIIGKNNEGKSNILRALDCAMNILLDNTANQHFYARKKYEDKIFYSARNDFPVAMHHGRDKITRFILRFELNDSDREEFKKKVGSLINNELSIEITIPYLGDPQKHFKKRGRGAAKLAEKSDKIVNFISGKIRSQYIGAVRTSDESIDVVSQMVDAVLSPLTKHQEYRNAIKAIQSQQKPILDQLSSDVKDMLTKFIPTIKEVKINSPLFSRMRNFGCRIEIDDGHMTPLEQKGDGIKSLVSLCLLRNKHKFNGVSLIALEEPEAHLHQGAIHHLKEIIYDISTENQVILSTHNPAFIDRVKFEYCMIVENDSVRAASNVHEIRSLLGIKLSDSLIAAEIVVICEGESDTAIIRKYLSIIDNDINTAIDEGKICFVSAHGASKIHMMCNMYKSLLCHVVAVMDDDEEGNKAYSSLEGDEKIDINSVFKIKCKDMHASEIEDCIDPKVYCSILNDKYGVDICGAASRYFRNNKNKWSDRICSAFRNCGRTFNKNIENDIKRMVAGAVKESDNNPFIQNKSLIFQLMTEYIKQML